MWLNSMFLPRPGSGVPKLMAPARPCSVCGKTTWRDEAVCEDCWKARQLIEESLGQAALTRIVLDLEAEWRMLDRIDNDLRRQG